MSNFSHWLIRNTEVLKYLDTLIKLPVPIPDKRRKST